MLVMGKYRIYIRLILGGFLALAGGSAFGLGWGYFRDVKVEGKIKDDTLAEIILAPEITSKCRLSMADVGLFDREGREIPFMIKYPTSKELTIEYSGDFVVNRESNGKKSTWTVDLGGERRFDRIEAEIYENSYLKPVVVDVSRDMKSWRRVRRSGLLYAGNSRAPGKYNSILLGNPASARFIRIIGDDISSSLVEPRGFKAVASDSMSGLRWHREVGFIRDKTFKGKEHMYRMKLRSNEVFDQVIVESKETKYRYSAGVYEKTAYNDPRAVAQRESPPPGINRTAAFFPSNDEPEFYMLWLGGGDIFSAKLGKPAVPVKSYKIDVKPREKGEIWIELNNGDELPPEGLSISVSGLSPRLMFAATSGKLILKYGNKEIEARSRPENIIQELENEGGGLLPARLGREKRLN